MLTQEQREKIINEFVDFACEALEIENKPKIVYVTDNSWVTDRRSFGEYRNDQKDIHVYVTNRNMADVLRTLGHELTHHRQNELGNIHPQAGKDGSDIENEANAEAGILMRKFGKKHKEIYESKKNIKFTKPNFEEEWYEAKRYPKLFANKEAWLKLAPSGKVQDIDCSMNIKNTDMCSGDLESLSPEKIARAKKAVKSGTVELPIILKIGDKYELLGGNTRITALKTLDYPTKAWVINIKK